jgi:hypothetical protein
MFAEKIKQLRVDFFLVFSCEKVGEKLHDIDKPLSLENNIFNANAK